MMYYSAHTVWKMKVQSILGNYYQLYGKRILLWVCSILKERWKVCNKCF
ncbi:unnamed protein product [Brugia pahangi]|uniref:Uncharacterized protein n=1 Tax=Brugia pahangi TaxID=6280 RepID=A0A0N4TZR1_BRUPA|nr:unnamed protein product [Brugia pahangi]